MENRGGKILIGKPKNPKKTLLQCHFAYNKPHMT
jgi:ubiquitin